MDKMWAPWRIKYVSGKKQKGCIFCQSAKSKDKDYLIFKTEYSISLLNTFPYNNGHALIAPKRHIRNIGQLKDAEVIDLFNCIEKTQRLLDKVLNPSGFNIGINCSRSAGAGIAGHLHIHIVPRWLGDTNFMPVIFNTKVISQSLVELLKKLKGADRCSPKNK